MVQSLQLLAYSDTLVQSQQSNNTNHRCHICYMLFELALENRLVSNPFELCGEVKFYLRPLQSLHVESTHCWCRTIGHTWQPV